METPAVERVNYLRKFLLYHNYRYYHLDDPEISDYSWDLHFHELRKLEEQYPELLTEDSPTQTVGYNIRTRGGA